MIFRTPRTEPLDGGSQAPYARCDVVVGPEAVALQQMDVLPDSRRVTSDFSIRELTFGDQFRCISLGGCGFAVPRHVTLSETYA